MPQWLRPAGVPQIKMIVVLGALWASTPNDSAAVGSLRAGDI